jgi:hypothetical protein
MIEFLLNAYFFYIAFLLLSFFIGKSLLRFLKYNDLSFFEFVFSSVLLGFFSIIIVFSLFYSRFFGTVNSIFLLLIIYWLYVQKKQTKISLNAIQSVDWGNMLLVYLSVFVSLSILFVLNCYLRINSSEWPYFNATKDEIFYSLLTKFIESKHIESASIDWYNYVGGIDLRPYHYTEHWLNLLFVEISNVCSIQTMYFIAYPIFLAITFFGVLSMFKHNAKLHLYVFLGLLLSVSGILYLSLDDGIKLGTTGLLYGGFKYMALFWLVFLAYIFFQRKKWDWMFAVFSFLAIINYAFLPIQLAIILFYLLFYSRFFGQKKKWFVLISLVVPIIGIVILKKINHHPDFSGQYDQKFSELIDYYTSGQLLLKIKLIVSMAWLFFSKKAIVYLIPIISFLLYLKLLKPNFNKAIAVFLVYLIITSLAFAGVLNFMIDAQQIFDMTFVIIVSIVFLIVLIRLLEGRLMNNTIRISLLLFVSIITFSFIINKSDSKKFEIFQRYDKNYLTTLQEECLKRKKEEVWIGVRFMEKNYYNSIYQIQSTDQFEGFPFAFLTDELHLFTLNPENAISHSSDPLGIYKFAYERLSNIEYYNNWAKETGFNIFEKESGLACQLKFIKEFSVDFIVAQKGVTISNEIMELVDEEVVNPVNGERIYFINKKLLSSIP